MLVDDDEETREVFRDLLADAGYEVMVAADGADACRLLAFFRADLVVTDLEMPRMDGLQLIRWVRRARPSCSILLVTGRSDRELQLCRFGRRAGFECMQKPLDVDRFGQAVQRLTSSVDRGVASTMAG